jgi:hypothetical protein
LDFLESDRDRQAVVEAVRKVGIAKRFPRTLFARLSTAFALPNHLQEGEPMNKEGLVHEVSDDERKAFVRAYVHRAMHRLQKRRRSKTPIQAKLNETICDVLTNTDQGRLRIVAEANFQRQKLQLRKFLRTRVIISYKDMKDFIHAHGWDELDSYTALASYWRSIRHMGSIGRTATVTRNLPGHRRGRSIQSSSNLTKRRT